MSDYVEVPSHVSSSLLKVEIEIFAAMVDHVVAYVEPANYMTLWCKLIARSILMVRLSLILVGLL